jgi:phosphoribosylaminoimidazolecarboxamide formyltransferase/IMP cyclohydrolase
VHSEARISKIDLLRIPIYLARNNIVSDENRLQEQGISQISVVFCNLHQFTSTISKAGCTLADVVEEINIGGVSLLRAAAKNF